PVQAVRLRGSDLDDDRLVHLVRDHGPEADLAPAASSRRGCLSCAIAHSASSFLDLRPRLGFGASSACSTASSSAGGSATATAAGEVSSSTLGAMPKSRSRI